VVTTKHEPATPELRALIASALGKEPFVGERVVLVDWSDSRRGNRQHDLASALTALPLEGGPDPFDVLPDGAHGLENAAMACDLFAAAVLLAFCSLAMPP
jgi:hypothetical protein